MDVRTRRQLGEKILRKIVFNEILDKFHYNSSNCFADDWRPQGFPEHRGQHCVKNIALRTLR